MTLTTLLLALAVGTTAVIGSLYAWEHATGALLPFPALIGIAWMTSQIVFALGSALPNQQETPPMPESMNQQLNTVEQQIVQKRGDLATAVNAENDVLVRSIRAELALLRQQKALILADHAVHAAQLHLTDAEHKLANARREQRRLVQQAGELQTVYDRVRAATIAGDRDALRILLDDITSIIAREEA